MASFDTQHNDIAIVIMDGGRVDVCEKKLWSANQSRLMSTLC